MSAWRGAHDQPASVVGIVVVVIAIVVDIVDVVVIVGRTQPPPGRGTTYNA